MGEGNPRKNFHADVEKAVAQFSLPEDELIDVKSKKPQQLDSYDDYNIRVFAGGENSDKSFVLKMCNAKFNKKQILEYQVDVMKTLCKNNIMKFKVKEAPPLKFDFKIHIKRKIRDFCASFTLNSVICRLTKRDRSLSSRIRYSAKIQRFLYSEQNLSIS